MGDLIERERPAVLDLVTPPVAFLGIDPGLEGAWCLYRPATNEIEAGDLPTSGTGSKRRIEGALLAAIIRAHAEITTVVIEMASPGFKGGRVSMFRYGAAHGVVLGVIAALGLPFVSVTPQKWKKHFGLRGPDKEPSRQLALARWPKHAGLFGRKRDHGRAEAALIARYGAEAA